MASQNPYEIILSRHMTEKAHVLQSLQSNVSNACVRKCVTPKYVFIVDKRANKQQIANAIQSIYSGTKVLSVNTINVPQKERRMRGRKGMKAGFKKAIVTLQPGDVIEEKA
jgi:large subunit ribosomal protein L23